MEVDTLRRTYALLSALKANLPKHSHIHQKYVTEYHNVIDRLEAGGLDLSEFRIPAEQIKRILTSMNYLSGEKRYSDDLFVEESFFMTKLDALLGYFVLAIDNKKPQIGFAKSEI